MVQAIVAVDPGNAMPLDLVIIPCLQNNFAYLIRDPASGIVALVDAPEAAPILAALRDRGLGLDLILLTHHHADHVQAVDEIRAATAARVLGAAADRHRLPALDHALSPGDVVEVGAAKGHVIDVPGHTLGHIAFHFAEPGLAFTADSLMAAGCGRLFEGTPAQMHDSLQRLAALPDETLICSGHDYLNGNLRFATHLEPGNPAITLRIDQVERMRREGQLPMPWTLAQERETNPFLRAHLPQMKEAVGLPGAPDVAVFAEIRARKDKF